MGSRSDPIPAEAVTRPSAPAVQGTLALVPPSAFEPAPDPPRGLRLPAHARMFWELLRRQSVLPLILCTVVFLVTLLWIMPASISNNVQRLGGAAVNVADVDAEITALSLKLGVASIAILVLTGMLLWRVFRWSLFADRQRICAERALAESNERLAETNRRLQVKQKQLEGFLYAVSHDLRAPLISIQGFASLLEKQVAGPPSEQTLRCFQRIESNIRHMEGLLSDLMTLSQIGHIEEHTETISIGALAREIVDVHAPELERRHIAACVDGEMPMAAGRPNRIRQLLSNLIHNAIKYMPDQKQATIAVGFDRTVRSPHGIRGAYYVRDNGPGIQPAEKDKVFDLFQRGANPQARDGSGLGLTIVRDIAESHGGCVWVESDPGCGSTFYFQLPEPALPQAPRQPPPLPNGS